jgi:CO/xanthine dehydrogenase Mo-binding subunit
VKCLEKLRTLINWEEGASTKEENNLIRAKGISCLIKTSDTPTDAGAGVILTFNSDGSINLDCGAVEIGPGMKTTAAQILSEKMKMNVDDIFVKMNVDTQSSPYYWKTVASMTTHIIGQAVISAADDVINQLLGLGAIALRCTAEDLYLESKAVFLKYDPTIFIAFKDLIQGYKYTNGNTIMGPVIGRGSYVMNNLTPLDETTGKGRPGKSWTVGAQAVEIEYDTKQHTYRLIKAASVIDAGKVLNPRTAKGIVMGGMCMGLGLGTNEEFIYDNNGIVENTSFRTYKMLRYGEAPEYLVEFIETPQIDAPYGARGIGEHGIIGIPAALANAISSAAQIDVTCLPITPEYIWRKKIRA